MGISFRSKPQGSKGKPMMKLLVTFTNGNEYRVEKFVASIASLVDFDRMVRNSRTIACVEILSYEP